MRRASPASPGPRPRPWRSSRRWPGPSSDEAAGPRGAAGRRHHVRRRRARTVPRRGATASEALATGRSASPHHGPTARRGVGESVVREEESSRSAGRTGVTPMLNAVGKRLSLPLGDLLHAAQLGAASPRSAARGALAFQPSDRAWPGFAARAMAIKKSELYASLWSSCDELARAAWTPRSTRTTSSSCLFVKYVSDKAASLEDVRHRGPQGGQLRRHGRAQGRQGDRRQDEQDHRQARRARTTSRASSTSPTGTTPTSWARARTWSTACPTWSPSSTTRPRLPRQPRRRRRPARRRLRVPDAPLRHREWQEQGPVLHAGRGVADHGQGHRRRRAPRVAKQTIYDPTCGSGSLLLKAHDEAKSATGLDLAVYGQEMDNATKALAKHEPHPARLPHGEIWQDNTCRRRTSRSQDRGALKTFDFVVANPPFSTKAWTNGFDPANDRYGRFALGVPPPKNGDYAFLLHILACLKSTGKGAIILPHGVLFRGGAEASIRREIVRAATSRASSACRPTCSTAPASRPASWCSTRRAPPAARASS
jgi:hypothetical protein